LAEELDPDRYFNARGFLLRVEERNVDASLPPGAATRGHTHWADLVAARNANVVAPSYGSGFSEAEAKERAVERWREEQEPPGP
jgi:hypothetical protein